MGKSGDLVGYTLGENKRVHAQETTFSKLVQGEKQFQVPLYQRTYSWQREELQQLWDDVLELVEDQLEDRPSAAHFLGSIVLAPGRITAGGMQCWLVVDGQQRLTTLMLAFTALRTSIGSEARTRRLPGSTTSCWSTATGMERTTTACCRPRPTGMPSPPVSNPRRRPADPETWAARTDFLGAFATGEEGGGEAWTDAVETVLSSLLSIVEITAAEGDNVYRIFESINNTGVGLSQSDLLRNYPLSAQAGNPRLQCPAYEPGDRRAGAVGQSGNPHARR